MKVKLSPARVSATLQVCLVQVRDGSGSMPGVALRASLPKGCFPLCRGQHSFVVQNIPRAGPSLGWTRL